MIVLPTSCSLHVHYVKNGMMTHVQHTAWIKNLQPVIMCADAEHQGAVVIFGDLKQGASVVAGGDVLVWGK